MVKCNLAMLRKHYIYFKTRIYNLLYLLIYFRNYFTIVLNWY